MTLSSRRRSFAETVEWRRRLLGRIKTFFLLFLGFELLTGLFLGAYAIGSSTMAPSLLPGERLIASPLPFGPSTMFGKLPAPARPERGDLVLARPPLALRPRSALAFADALVRFVTLQRVSLVARGGEASEAGPFIVRVIALPGDSIEMRDFVFRVRPAGSEHYLTEFELSKSRYDIRKPELPSGWRESFPLSGSMPMRTLGSEEYFVACDDRGATADSRLWGPVSRERFEARVLLRYWPLTRFGLP